MKSVLGLCVISMCLIGCGSTQVNLPPFNSSQAQFAMEHGSGTIEGDLFAKTIIGDVKDGAGCIVYLAPYSSHIEEYWRSFSVEYRGILQGGYEMEYLGEESFDPLARNYIKSTRADGDGRFEFTNVPNGEYLVHGVVSWKIPDSSGSYDIEAGSAVEKVTVSRGKTAKVSLYCNQ